MEKESKILNKLKVKYFLKDNESKILDDLKKLIAIKSTDENPTKESPLGRELKYAFDFIEKISIRDKLKYKRYSNYAFEISIGDGEQEYLLLNHIDVVGIDNFEKWNTNPWEMVLKERELFGRGVNDNKGPLIYSYYLFKFLNSSQEFKNLIKNKDICFKLVIGGSEETSWRGIEHYKSKNKEPKFVITSDGNFPAIFLEKSILHLTISKEIKNDSNLFIYSEKQKKFACNLIKVIESGSELKFISDKLVKSRNPNRIGGNSSIDQLMKFVNKKNKESPLQKELSKQYLMFHKFWRCEKIRIKNWNSLTSNTICISSINLNKELLKTSLDLRFNSKESLKSILNYFLSLGYSLNIDEYIESHYIDPKSIEMKCLTEALREKVSFDPKPISFSGKSYARAFKNAVAFGVSFPGESTNCHAENEKQNIDSLISSTIIIQNSFLKIFKLKERK